jgi:TonB-linked SusC/RagA family outer membrane protein
MRNTTGARATLFVLVTALLAIVTPARAAAQTAVITGRVLSESGQAVDGANVYINDLQLSVRTDARGNYTITVPPARVHDQAANLRVRAFGFQPQTRPIRISSGTQTVNFSLAQDPNRLAEIVVTGVVEGTERSKVPFSVARLSTEDMPVTALDPLRQLAGKVSGMRVAQVNGRPGATPMIMFRGPTSINATGRNSGPLIIVDDVIMNVGSLEELSALDIESVEVTKGAAGSSLYGSRAANGVINIKTKRGTAQESIQFTSRNEYGISDLNSIDYGLPTNHHLSLDETGKRFCIQGSGNVPSCARTVDWMTEIMRINNVNADTTRTPQTIQYNAPGALGNGELQNTFQANIWPGRYYNAFAQVLNRNPVALTSIDASGRAGAVRFFASGSYQNEQGAIKGLRGIQQRRGRVNLDYDARQDVTIAVSTLFDNGVTDLRSGGSSNGAIFGQLLRGAPAGVDYTRLDTLGRYIIRGGGGGLRGSGNGAGGLLYDMQNDNNHDARNSSRYLGSLTSRYFPVDWFSLEGTVAYDYRARLDRSWFVKGYRTTSVSAALNNGQMSSRNSREDAFNSAVTATFRKALKPDLTGKAVLKALYDQDKYFESFGTGQVFQVKDIFTLTNTQTNKNVTSLWQTDINQGFLAGANLEYKDRYVLDGTFRYDGSSRFGSGNRWAPFNRISGVWRVAQESFWNVGWMDDFRLRASRGTAGGVPRFSAQYETYNVASSGITLGQAGNSKLKPETTTEYELGTDFTLMKRLGVDITHAIGTTRDQILFVNTPSSLGFAQQWQNAGTLQNKTWELGLNLPIINRQDLSWSMRGTWDRTRTAITQLFVPSFYIDAGTSQGTGNMFRITADREYKLNGIDLSNGFQVNRFGNIYGRRFYKSCTDLPTAALRGACGSGAAGDTHEYQINDQGYVVWVGNGNNWRDGITKNLWQSILPGAVSPWGTLAPLVFGMPIVARPLKGEQGEGVGYNQIIGNVFPKWRFSYSNSVQYKRVSLYGLIDGTMGHNIFNQGEQWGLFDFNSAKFDNRGRTVETAKPTGYGWRTGPVENAGIGGFYDVLGPNNYSVEDASFAKVRELSLTYKVGPIPGVGGDWTVGFIGRNLFTFTGYSGYDPEVGCDSGIASAGGACGGGGSNNSGTGNALINQVDAFGFPTLRTFTLSLSTRF